MAEQSIRSPLTNDAVTSWSDASTHALNSYVEANRALLAGFGLSSSASSTTPDSPETTEDSNLAFECSAGSREELGVGEFVRLSKVVTDEDVHGFADLSGDANPLHLDEAFAERTRFGGRIVHGTLVSGLISAALARLPGVTIYLSQDLDFEKPVRVGAEITADCEIVEDLGGDRYRLDTVVTTADGETAIDGEAVVLVDELPEEDEPEGN